MIRVFAKTSVLSICAPFFVCRLAVIRLRELWMSFKTYQLMANEDHTSGCRRMTSGNCSPMVVHRSQSWLCETAPPDQIVMFWHHKFSPETTKAPQTGHTAVTSGTPSCTYVLFALLSPKRKIWAQRQHLQPLSVNAGLLWCWHLKHRLRVTTTGEVILGLVSQRVLTNAFCFPAEWLQSGRAAARKKQQCRLCR